MSKESLRKNMLAKRMEFLHQGEFSMACENISRNLAFFLSQLPEDKKRLIGGYSPVKGEVDLTSLYKHLDNLAFPRLIFIKDHSEIEYAKIVNIDDLYPSKLSFKAPSERAPVCFPDIIIVPGICYDKSYHRVGYGRGHFDKFIANSKKSNYNPMKIGVCFDFQLLNAIPNEAHDQTMDVIITESTII